MNGNLCGDWTDTIFMITITFWILTHQTFQMDLKNSQES